MHTGLGRCTLRLVRLNGKGLIVTADLGLNRIDVSVEDGIVVDAH
ncbi:MAG: hypothetical protein ACRD08_12490 [Acidimicrobiales bacterium]